MGRSATKATLRLSVDIENLRGALAEQEVEEAFLPSMSPRGFGRNEFYDSEADYYAAVAEAMREEYLGIVDAGFILQIDDPWLIEILSDPRYEVAERKRTVAEHVEILNQALRGIPEEKIRLHTCYGLNHGPRLNDVPMLEVVAPMLDVTAGAYSFEVANPRHYHEWQIWQDVKLPDGKILIPGLLGHATNYVEHPEMIAEYIVKYARLVGRENVIAGGRLRILLAREFRAGGSPERGLGKTPRALGWRSAGDTATMDLTGLNNPDTW